MCKPISKRMYINITLLMIFSGCGRRGRDPAVPHGVHARAAGRAGEGVPQGELRVAPAAL